MRKFNVTIETYRYVKAKKPWWKLFSLDVIKEFKETVIPIEAEDAHEAAKIVENFFILCTKVHVLARIDQDCYQYYSKIVRIE